MGIPARYASGYVVFPEDFEKSENADGYEAVVTDQRAHAWAEIYLEDFGWVPLEVTPGFAGAGAADGQENADDEKPASAAGDSAEDATDGSTLDEEQDEPEKANDQPSDKADSAANPGGDKDADAAAADGGILDEELLGLSLRQWLYGFAGVLAAALAVWLVILLCRSYRRKQEELLRRELRSGQYKAAINRMNRRVYRRLCGRHLLGAVRIRDDESYRTALEKRCGAQEIDVSAYMRLVKEAYFSGGEMRAEDAETVYRMYLLIREAR